ncbi:MAG: TraU family protein [Deltaproteobacteria bacterium]|nr:TraU family protein [Deltaproteobacteria bacterium]
MLDLAVWDSIYPLYVAGVKIAPGTDGVSTNIYSNDPICTCPAYPVNRVGFTIGFWEPARLIETVKDPGCFLSVGISSSFGSGPPTLAGTTDSAATGHPFTFAQAHYYIFPVWSMLEIITDSVCFESSGFDLAYITEVDAMWQDDSLAAILTPENVLFANPIATLACIADSIGSAAGMSFSPFWCMGSWGSAYPLTGSIGTSNVLNANAGLAARMLYKLSRELLVCDTNVYECSCIPTPIWIKGNYKMHISYPIKDYIARSIGTTGLLWNIGKNPPIGGENFIWTLYRIRNCCAF